MLNTREERPDFSLVALEDLREPVAADKQRAGYVLFLVVGARTAE
ncbi:MAG: hypothetical protein ABSF03_06840 [Streptosporangiaceae bacterium]